MPAFEVDATWPRLPNNWVMGDPSSIAVDRHDNIWILHRPRTVPAEKKDHAAPPVLEFDKNGKFLQAWGGQSDQGEWPDTEHGIYVDYKDNVWIGGNNPNVQIRVSQRSDDQLLKFTNKGKLVMQIGRRDQSQGNKDTKNLHQPADVQVIQKTNEAVIADGYGNRRIIVLDADTGAFKRLWGAFGNEPHRRRAGAGRGSAPRAPRRRRAISKAPGRSSGASSMPFAISNDGLVYVADRGNSRVQVFTLDGKYQTQVFVNRKDKNAATACGLALSSDPQQKYLYVSDFGNGHVWILDRKALRVLGSFRRAGARARKLPQRAPYGD